MKHRILRHAKRMDALQVIMAFLDDAFISYTRAQWEELAQQIMNVRSERTLYRLARDRLASSTIPQSTLEVQVVKAWEALQNYPLKELAQKRLTGAQGTQRVTLAHQQSMHPRATYQKLLSEGIKVSIQSELLLTPLHSTYPRASISGTCPA